MTTNQVICAIVIMAAVTIAIRFFPFVIFRGAETPAWINYLGQCLPYAIMGMLVVYCLRSIDFASPRHFLPELIAGAAVIVSYLVKRNTLISIILGTACYMFFVQVLFV